MCLSSFTAFSVYELSDVHLSHLLDLPTLERLHTNLDEAVNALQSSDLTFIAVSLPLYGNICNE